MATTFGCAASFLTIGRMSAGAEETCVGCHPTAANTDAYLSARAIARWLLSASVPIVMMRLIPAASARWMTCSASEAKSGKSKCACVSKNSDMAIDRLANADGFWSVFCRFGAEIDARKAQDQPGGHPVGANRDQRMGCGRGEHKVGDLEGDVEDDAQQQAAAGDVVNPRGQHGARDKREQEERALIAADPALLPIERQDPRRPQAAEQQTGGEAVEALLQARQRETAPAEFLGNGRSVKHMLNQEWHDERRGTPALEVRRQFDARDRRRVKVGWIAAEHHVDCSRHQRYARRQ